MNTFSRLNLLTLLFLGIVLMLVAGTIDAQQDGLTVETDKQGGYRYRGLSNIKIFCDT